MPSTVEGWKDETYGNEIREHLFEFAEEGWEAIPEDEHDAWFERFKWGRCTTSRRDRSRTS